MHRDGWELWRSGAVVDTELLLPDSEICNVRGVDLDIVAFPAFRKKSRKKHYVHHAGTEDAATPEYAVSPR